MKSIVVATVLFAAPLFAADRPTEEQIRKAVAESRAAYVAEHTPTVESITEELALLQRDFNQAKKRRDRTDMRTIGKEMAEKKRSLRDARRGEFPDIQPQLMPIDWNRLAVGQVGHLDGSGVLRCIQRLEDGRFLGTYENTTRRFAIPNKQGGVVRGGGNKSVKGPYVFVGLKDPEFQQDRGHKSVSSMDVNLIVTGEYEYEAVDGSSRIVLVLESFDPEKPFSDKDDDL